MRTALLALALVAAPAIALAADPATPATPATPAAAPAHPAAAPAHPATPAQKAPMAMHATGTVKAIDATKHAVTVTSMNAAGAPLDVVYQLDKTLVLAPGIAAGSKVDVTYHAGAQGTASEIATVVALHK